MLLDVVNLEYEFVLGVFGTFINLFFHSLLLPKLLLVPSEIIVMLFYRLGV